MIVGNGDIANALRGIDKGKLYFASGVSNSQEIREEEYDREINLLLEQDSFQHLVYFSSLCIFYSNSRYARHKKEIEKIVSSKFYNHTIVRIGNIAWGSNPYTLINFIRNKIRNRESFEVEDVYRYILGKEEFIHWMLMIPDWSCEMNIVGRRMKVIDIVKEYCYPWGIPNGSTQRNYTEQELQVCIENRG
jgi:hypothetical protein